MFVAVSFSKQSTKAAVFRLADRVLASADVVTSVTVQIYFSDVVCASQQSNFVWFRSERAVDSVSACVSMHDVRATCTCDIHMRACVRKLIFVKPASCPKTFALF